MARKLLIAGPDSAASNSHRGTNWVWAALAGHGGAEAWEKPRVPRLCRLTRGSRARKPERYTTTPGNLRLRDRPVSETDSSSGRPAWRASQLAHEKELGDYS